jgi:ribosomal protein L16 Arg81 hydroxylase
MMWIGPAGTFTSLHHDLTNNLIAQLVGRKQVKLVPASEVGKLYNHRHVFSEISDLDDPTIDMTRFPRLPGLRVYEVTLAAGEILFVPFAWWHQVRALDFSVTVTYTNFHWPNDAYKTYPSG